VNHEATRAVLHAADRHGLRALVTSSSEVYGSNPNPTFREDDICMIGPTRKRRWGYSASKLLDEFHAFAFYYERGLPVTVVRLFNTIGPRQVGTYGMVVPTFLKQALAGEPITVYGTGEQRRSFTDVGDVTRCLDLLLRTEDSIGQVFNIGSTNEISILELAREIIALTGSSSPIRHLSYKEAYGENFEDVSRRYPDTSNLRETVGTSPDTPLRATLERMREHL
jgi:UDP-glucose 4-epimerase